MLLHITTESHGAITDAYKTLQAEPHTSTPAVEHTVSMGPLTSARCCSNSLTGPPQTLFHRRMPNSSGRTAILPYPVHPAGWITLTLTHCRCTHIWLVAHEFPGILRERHFSGYWYIHSKEKACPLRRISEDKSWLMTAPILMDLKHPSAHSLGYGGEVFEAHPLDVNITYLKLQST